MIFIYIVLCLVVIMGVLALLAKPGSVYKNNPIQQNPMQGKKVKFVDDPNEPENADGKRGHLVAAGETEYRATSYERYVKRAFDIILSFCGLILLSPVFLVLSIWIYMDNPGPIVFTQKRVGQNKQFFRLHKFRSMKVGTPHDCPTHMLENPEQYITKSGKFIRAHSLDELPQIWDIFIGNMSIIGPRPGLWNQDWLIACREEYGANNSKPGLTGWAQINGRDELEIEEKAKYDGEYVSELNKGVWNGLKMDLKCFVGSIKVIIKDDSIVEGEAGEVKKNE